MVYHILKNYFDKASHFILFIDYMMVNLNFARLEKMIRSIFM